jgi:hypothetical protein
MVNRGAAGTGLVRTVRVVGLASPDYWSLDLSAPTRVVFLLPEGASLVDARSIRTIEGTCATWYDGSSVGVAMPVVQTSVFGTIVVTCEIPSQGSVNDIMFELPFTWPDASWGNAGIGQYRGGTRLAGSGEWPTDIALPAAEFSTDYLIPEGLEVTARLGGGRVLTEAFPQPSSGRLTERTWTVHSGGDIEYFIEVPSDRVWVQPLQDPTLLTAGLAFGLLPSTWRRRYCEHPAG